MPCRDDSPHYVTVENPKVKERLDQVTQFLCYLCGELMEDGHLSYLQETRLSKWWKDHQKKDTTRVTSAIKRRFTTQVKKSGRRNPTSVADDLISSAEKVHPVSRYHKQWFRELCRTIDKELTIKEIEAQRKAQRKKQKRASGKAKLTKSELLALGVK